MQERINIEKAPLFQQANFGSRLASIKLNGKHAQLQVIDRDQLNRKLREQFV